MSSAQAVGQVKRLIQDKVGHAGTLDPEATGVLPLLVGRATRLFDYITEKEKVYSTFIDFGGATDTQDAEGQIVQDAVRCPDTAELRSVLLEFIGDILQVPPQYSALKRNGKPLYEWAREGEKVELEARAVRVSAIEHLRVEKNGHWLRVSCGKGTYIRTLCHDIGQRLGCPAHMRYLIREQSGVFRIENAATAEDIRQAVLKGETEAPWLMTLDRALAFMPQVIIPPILEEKALNGVPIPCTGELASDFSDGKAYRVYVRGSLLCIGAVDQGFLKIKTMLNPELRTQASQG